MGEDECDEGEVRRSFMSGKKFKMQQEILLSLLNMLETVSLIPECPRFHRPCKKNQKPLKISFLK